MSRARGVACLVLAAAAGCARSGPTDPGAAAVELRTEHASYVARPIGSGGGSTTYEVRVVAVLENRGPAPVSIARCSPDSPHPLYGVGLVEAPAGARAAYGGVWACVGHDRPIRVDPGQSRTDTLRLLGSERRGLADGDPTEVATGEMRLRYFLEDCGRGNRCAAPSGRVDSNVFTVAMEAAP